MQPVIKSRDTEAIGFSIFSSFFPQATLKKQCNSSKHACHDHIKGIDIRYGNFVFTADRSE